MTLLCLILLFCGLCSQTLATGRNFTLDDNDSSIVYQPPGSWRSSAVACSSCLTPQANNAFGTSYHAGIHVLPTNDDDDPTQTQTQTQTKSSSLSPSPSSSQSSAGDNDADGNQGKTSNSGKPDNDGENDGDEKPSKSGSSSSGSTPGGSQRRNLKRQRIVQRMDIDDEGFQDVPVTMQINFTGSAVYLNCIKPLATSNSDALPTALNLTFTLDNTPDGGFNFTGKSTNLSSFQYNFTVYKREGLSEASHVLLVNVQPGSAFLFDSVTFTQNKEDQVQNGTSTTSQTQPLSSSSPTVDSRTKQHNIATFGAAVGGSVGVLGIFSICLAFSIIRRRRIAARRDRRDHESLHTNASEDSPHMSGPLPFVPRFFPGTIIPSDPPTYVDALTMSPSLATSPLLASITDPYASSRHTDRSYADIPPDTEPPPVDDGSLFPPPPFPLAVSDQPPQTPLSLSSTLLPTPVISGPEQESHGSNTVGDSSLDSDPDPSPSPRSSISQPSSRASLHSSLTPERHEAGT